LSKKLKWYYLPIGIICLLIITLGGYLLYSIEFRTHAAPEFNIGNSFNQTVEVYINGYKMVKINSGDSKRFYPYDILPANQDDILVELKTTSGKVLFPKVFTFEDAVENMGYGKILWIGN
jgi:hypothetical protein